MAYKGQTFDSLQELLDYLNDVVVGRRALKPKIYDLNGKTLKINDGTLKTVTFSGSELTPKDVVEQINTQTSAGTATLRNPGHGVGQPYLAFASAGDVIDKTGTANSSLGLPTGADTTVGANAVVQADIVAITPDESGNKFTVVHA